MPPPSESSSHLTLIPTPLECYSPSLSPLSHAANSYCDLFSCQCVSFHGAIFISLSPSSPPPLSINLFSMSGTPLSH